MPPRMKHEDVYDQGGIEVVVIDDEEAIVENRALPVPPSRPCQSDEELDLFDESVELTDNFMDQLLSGFGLGCAGCSQFQLTTAPPIAGILKKPGHGSPPHLGSRTVSFSSLEIKEFDLTLGNVRLYCIIHCFSWLLTAHFH